jgi:hypothetical protein
MAVQLAKNKTSSFKKMEWILGRWEIRTSNYFYCENWEKENDTAYTGKSIMLVSGDTVLYDIMNIKSNKQIIYLSNKSKINTEGSTNIFKLTNIKKDRIIFENPANTEENKITYILKTPVTLNIMIEGKENSVESYGLRKINK